MLLTGVDNHKNGVGNLREAMPRESLGQPGYPGSLATHVVTVGGRDAAFALAARGHKVSATTFNEAQAVVLRGECAAQGVAMEVFALDITDAAQRERIRPLALDVLINNAASVNRGRWPRSTATACAATSRSMCSRRWR